MSALDQVSAAQAFSMPGMDPRGWVSYGLVNADTPSARNVLFNDETGAALPYPLVIVTLQPSGITLPCRVSGRTAGAGTGSWNPFLEGDEVLVVVPQGDEREGGVIIGRMNQTLDTFPTLVAGNDTTQNNFAFDRHLEPYLLESGTALLFRVSATSSFLSLDQTGNVTLQDGEGNLFTMSQDFLGLQLKDGSTMLQISTTTGTLFMQAKGAQFLLDPSGSGQILTQQMFSIGTSGNPPQWHATTIEAVLGLFQALSAILIPLGPAPLTGASLGALLNPAGMAAIIQAAAVLPFTLSGPLATALASGTLATPNVGIPGLLLG